ncbi:hypothetical protein pipiens_004831 [Culex pipiens pipiens]|uniref:Uncharacterized protein n=1 Tax=Culex pipiens pipiens TaxID=38569 RepID=A0ABD1CEF5_CULPP
MDMIVMMDSFFFSVFALYGLPPLDVTIAMVKRLSGDKPLDREAISKIVAMHNSALECISLLEDIMNLIFLCYHFVFLVVLSFVLFGISKFGIKAPVPDRTVVSFGDRESACLNPISGRPSVPPENCIDTETECGVGRNR